jgi:glutathione S-transferase
MAKVKIYGMPISSFTRTARLICHEKGVDYQFMPILPGEAAVAAGHPFGRIPVLRHGANTVYESRAIARYVEANFDGPELIPTQGKAAVLCETFVSIACDYIYKDLVVGVLIPRFGFREAPESEVAAAIEKVKGHFAMLDRHLADNRFLAGDSLSLADLYLVPPFFHVRKIEELHAVAADNWPNLIRWAKTMGQRASVKATDPDLAAPAEKAA